MNYMNLCSMFCWLWEYCHLVISLDLNIIFVWVVGTHSSLRHIPANLTNQRLVMFCVNQSEISIVLCQPIAAHLSVKVSVVSWNTEGAADPAVGVDHLIWDGPPVHAVYETLLATDPLRTRHHHHHCHDQQTCTSTNLGYNFVGDLKAKSYKSKSP